MTMRWAAWGFALSVLGISPAFPAQEPEATFREERSSAPARFFDRPIEFWGGQAESARLPDRQSGSPPALHRPTSPPDGPPGPGTREGSGSPRELPPELARVIEDPSPGNIRAYLDGRIHRIDRILAAIERIREYRERTAPEPEGVLPEGRGADHPPTSPLPQAQEPAPVPRFTLTYFHRKECPPCQIQDRILASWIGTHPEVRLEVIEFGTRPEAWRAAGIRGTPTLLLELEGTGKRKLLEGLTPAEHLERVLSERPSSESLSAARAGEAPK